MRTRILILCALVVIGVGCAEATPQPPTVETETPTTEALPTDTLPDATSSPAPTVETSAPAPDIPLAAEGPWLLFLSRGEIYAEKTLWATNPDGTGLTQIADEFVTTFAISPASSTQRGLVAYITANFMANPVLHIIQLPALGPVVSLPLTSAETVILSNPTTGEISNIDLARALTEGGNLAWSPDGAELAFVGAMNGTSADVYVYSMTTGAVRQLTSGDTQAADLHWSPDGRYIVHQGVINFGTGAGMSVDAMWAAPTDGSAPLRLYSSDDMPEDSYGGDAFLGWYDDDTFVVHPWSPGCGDGNLRAVTIGGAITPLWNDCMTEAAFDPQSRNILLVSPDAFHLDENEQATPGIYLIAYGSTTPRLLPDLPGELGYFVDWSEVENLFLVIGGAEPLAFTASGEHVPYKPQFPDAGNVVFSADGRYVVLNHDKTVLIGAAPDYALHAFAPELNIDWWSAAWVP
jgi:hypothetical protein